MARMINDEMPSRTAEKIRRIVKNHDRPKIVALGATYKKNCEDVRESPAIEIVTLLLEDGYNVRHYDPKVPSMQYSSLKAAAKDADLIVVLVAHDVVCRELNDQRFEIESEMRNVNIVFFDE